MNRRILTPLVLAVVAFFVVGSTPSGVAPSSEDPHNLVYSVAIDERGGTGPLTVTAIPPSGFRTEQPESVPKPREWDPVPPAKLHPDLADPALDPEQPVRVLVNLRDDVAIQRFPDLPTGVARESPAAAPFHAETEARIAQLRLQRASAQQPILQDIEQMGLRVHVTEQFWLVNAFAADTVVADARLLAEREDVLYVEPNDLGGAPPNHDANAANDVDDGRARIVSDPYYNLAGMTGGYIGLLDTGVRATHTLFSSPTDLLDYVRDCTTPTTSGTCGTTGGDDDCWNHGTSSAGIISGNANLGNAHRGVTGVILDSWKVYPAGCGGLDAAASVRGFQDAVAAFDRVIVAEMQAVESETGTIATAADKAFDAGAMVIAANGNNGPNAGTVNSPAIAHKVIGVGAYDVQSLTTYSGQSRGAAPDGRNKPDLQAPTNTETASRTSNTALHTFGGTSGATPYAAGAAALQLNWLKKHGASDPGQAYARLLIEGNKPWCCYDDTEGSGDLKLAVCGVAYWGKTSISGTGSTVSVSINVPSGKRDFEAALWWPEGASEAHDDIDVHLYDPSGTERAKGYSALSVFEVARVSGPLTAGTWTLKVKGYSVASGPQSVYWTADVHGC